MEASNSKDINQQELIQNTKRLSNLTKDLESTYLYMATEKEIQTTGKIRDLLLQMNGFMRAIVALGENTPLERKIIGIEKKFIQLNRTIDSEHIHTEVNKKKCKDFKREVDGFLHKIQD